MLYKKQIYNTPESHMGILSVTLSNYPTATNSFFRIRIPQKN